MTPIKSPSCLLHAIIEGEKGLDGGEALTRPHRSAKGATGKDWSTYTRILLALSREPDQDPRSTGVRGVAYHLNTPLLCRPVRSATSNQSLGGTMLPRKPPSTLTGNTRRGRVSCSGIQSSMDHENRVDQSLTRLSKRSQTPR